MTSAIPTRFKDPSNGSLVEQLTDIRGGMLALEQKYLATLDGLHQTHQASARNLVHYLALRRRDVRTLQQNLASLGLSSLGRMESHVLSGVESVLGLLHRLNGAEWDAGDSPKPALKLAQGEAALWAHTESLLGPAPNGRSVRIMVTMPSEAAHDYSLVRDLLAGGMDCMRINCAHDGPAEWESMIHHLKRARHELGRECRILMDVAGPKLRTGPLKPGPAVVRLRPLRNDSGHVLVPARIAIVSALHHGPVHAVVDAVLPVENRIPSAMDIGDEITFEDARGRRRKLVVSAVENHLLIAEIERTAYVMPGTILQVRNARKVSKLRVGSLQPKEQPIILRPGDPLVLTDASIPGKPAVDDTRGRLMIPASIGVTLPEVFRDVRSGDKIWLDDGAIGGIVRSLSPEQIRVEITQACPGGAKLRSDKGINLPDTDLSIPSLTNKDIEDLSFIAKHGDMVGYSFVRSEKDVHDLQQELAKVGGEHLGIILKIETRAAFECLPRLLLASMKSERFGVMIARGDLAVECGYERTAEVQEEILWICEAAHTPVIWATQVLESLAKTGVPSRAEVTDAAMSERAECVMLNKGPFIRNALSTLDDILRRMQAHQSKKRSMLRPLRLAQALVPPAQEPIVR
jgi:pyruvate kinase